MNKKPLFSVTKKDFEIQTFRAGGKGGQHQNTCDSGVRIIHKDSGAVGESREHRSQKQNKDAAFLRLTQHPKFKFWINKMMFRINGTEKEIKSKVERALNEKNLKIEIREDNKWRIE
jgi:protein subunit release factor B